MVSALERSSEIDPLTRLAIRYGTDKWGAHFYTPIYHQLFLPLRGKPIRLLEIGIGAPGLRTGGGASLRMWADYFPLGQIFGVDITPKTLSLDPRVKTFTGSQDDAAFLTRLCDEHGPFDIVIDDGSHLPRHVVASFSVLFPRLAQAGLYVIEDIQTTFWPHMQGSIGGGPTLQFAQSLMGYLNYAEMKVCHPNLQLPEVSKTIRSLRAYHNILIVEKGDNSEPSNMNYDLRNKHSERVIQTIEEELARSPTAEAFANLADVYRAGRDFARAQLIIDEALARWPDNLSLLCVAHDVALNRGDSRKVIEYLERLMKLEPDSLELKRMHSQALERFSLRGI